MIKKIEKKRQWLRLGVKRKMKERKRNEKGEIRGDREKGRDPTGPTTVAPAYPTVALAIPAYLVHGCFFFLFSFRSIEGD